MMFDHQSLPDQRLLTNPLHYQIVSVKIGGHRLGIFSDHQHQPLPALGIHHQLQQLDDFEKLLLFRQDVQGFLFLSLHKQLRLWSIL